MALKELALIGAMVGDCVLPCAMGKVVEPLAGVGGTVGKDQSP